MKNQQSGKNQQRDDQVASSVLSRIQTPYDDILPNVDDPSAQFYLDAMRIYLALCTDSITFEEAIDATGELKANPEFAYSPSNPLQLPINKHYESRILDNLKTLSKFNLMNRDSIRSAFAFAFSFPTTPISPTDLSVLRSLSKNPRASISSLAKELAFSSRTVSKALDRLQTRHHVRFVSLLDETIWNLQRVLVFFSPKKNVNWDEYEKRLLSFPFLKILLKTSMSELGYFSVIIPGDESKVRLFMHSLKKVTPNIFDYVSVHIEQATSAECNLSLLEDDKWKLPDVQHLLESDGKHLSLPHLVQSRGRDPTFTRLDYEVAAQAKLASRATTADILATLERRGIFLQQKKVTDILRSLYKRGILKPYLDFGLGLSSNLCFEIICDDNWKNRILGTLGKLPRAISMVSQRGIILWLLVPGYHQVEYYQTFKGLERESGVRCVNSIMTINMKGSRSILDLTDNLPFDENGFNAPAASLDLGAYLLEP